MNGINGTEEGGGGLRGRSEWRGDGDGGRRQGGFGRILEGSGGDRRWWWHRLREMGTGEVVVVGEEGTTGETGRIEVAPMAEVAGGGVTGEIDSNGGEKGSTKRWGLEVVSVARRLGQNKEVMEGTAVWQWGRWWSSAGGMQKRGLLEVVGERCGDKKVRERRGRRAVVARVW